MTRGGGRGGSTLRSRNCRQLQFKKISPSQNKLSKLRETVKARGAWSAAVHRVAKTQTPRSD